MILDFTVTPAPSDIIIGLFRVVVKSISAISSNFHQCNRFVFIPNNIFGLYQSDGTGD